MVVLVLLVAAAAGAAADAVQGAPLPRVGRVQQLPARQPYLEPHVRSTPFASACTAWYRRERESPSASVCLLPKLGRLGVWVLRLLLVPAGEWATTPSSVWRSTRRLSPQASACASSTRPSPDLSRTRCHQRQPNSRSHHSPVVMCHSSFDHGRQFQFGADPSGCRCGDVDRRAS